VIIFLQNTFSESISLWLDMSSYLILGMFIAGILHTYLNPDFISSHLGKGNLASIVKATLFGIPLPICSCGVIPVAASLRKEGASKSATLAFLVSTPTTGVDSILATYSLLGPLFAIFRPLAAFISGITVGVFNRLLNRETTTRKPERKAVKVSTVFKIKEVFRYGFIELAEDIGKWLVIGVLLGGLLSAAIPENWLVERLTHPVLHFLVILIFAIPLYVCATGSIPIAASLIHKGLSPGAALVFLIAGPATNTVTLSFVRSKLGKKAFYLYLTSIVVVALLLGWIFHLVWNSMRNEIAWLSPHGGMLSLHLRIASGILLLLIIFKGFLKKKRQTRSMQYQWSVPDMSCRKCQNKLENAVGKISNVDRVVVSLDSKTVGVDGVVNVHEIEETIKMAGYTLKMKN